MQISIEEHNQVCAGLATELVIRDRQLADAIEDRDQARVLIEQQDGIIANRDQQVTGFESKLERILQVAIGAFKDHTSGDDPAYSTSLNRVEWVTWKLQKAFVEIADLKARRRKR
jgi:hypothetical protein